MKCFTHVLVTCLVLTLYFSHGSSSSASSESVVPSNGIYCTADNYNLYYGTNSENVTVKHSRKTLLTTEENAAGFYECWKEPVDAKRKLVVAAISCSQPWNYTNKAGETKIKSNKTLLINQTDVGVYACNDGNSNLFTATLGNISMVFKRDRPEDGPVFNTHRSVIYHNGDKDKSLRCVVNTAETYPDAGTLVFQWKYYKCTGHECLKCKEEGDCTYETLSNGTEYSIKNDGASTELTFRNDSFYLITNEHAGFYECSVSNPAQILINGKNGDLLQVRVHDNLEALWPTLGLIAQLFIIVAVFFLNQHYTKKRLMMTSNMTAEEAKPIDSD